MPAPTVSGRTVVEEPPLFVEEQRFVPRSLSLAVLVGLAGFGLWAFATGLLRGEEWVPLAIGLGVALLFHLLQLDVTVHRAELEIRFRPLTHRRIELADVRSCRARTYRPLLEYGGWGVRRGWQGGWAYNVRGTRGVQLTLVDGTSILVGSQRAEELATAIQGAAGLAATGS